MMRAYRLDAALLSQGWVRDVRVVLDEHGRIRKIGPAAGDPQADDEPLQAPPERIKGLVVPGMSNAHSHAFQRGMAGEAEYRLSARDSFWTWRRAMYALANRMTPEGLEVLATRLFVEMLKSGYTAVAEFHYIHRRPDGESYPGANPLWEAVMAAARDAGIALTFLPTLYQASDFGGAPLREEQSRFFLETERFLHAIETLRREEAADATGLRRTGAAFHSLRAVPLETLSAAARELRRMDPGMPLHIHVAEQVKEVESCLAHTGRRPVELLLETGLLDRLWCLVHATHSTAKELEGIAASGASVCVSITTEANLGDGFFDAARFLAMGGRVAIGSDSQSSVCPAEELRWMEYQARLRKRRRAVLADATEPHVGTRLWRHGARAGAQAIGQPSGEIAVGARADWVVLDRDHASLAGAADEAALDHLLFAGASAAIRHVMVAGRWVVRDGRHALEESSCAAFRELMREHRAP